MPRSCTQSSEAVAVRNSQSSYHQADQEEDTSGKRATHCFFIIVFDTEELFLFS